MRKEYRVHGCIDHGDHIEGLVEDERAEFWGVYEVQEDGTEEWIADFLERDDAEMFVLEKCKEEKKIMRWETKQGDHNSCDRLEEFMRKYADEVEWVRKDEHGFSRMLGFKILGRYYEICWFNNYCELYVGGVKNRPLTAGFNAIYTDTCYPVCLEGNDNLTFEYKGMAILRIPLKAGSL